MGDAPEIEYDSYKVNLIIDKDKDADGAYNYEDDCPNTYGRKEKWLSNRSNTNRQINTKVFGSHFKCD